MSFCRAMHPPVTSSTSLCRFVSKASSRQCAQAVRGFSSYGHIFHSSNKRDMQTATAYRPHSLPTSFPLPRSSGVPDTSIPADFSQPIPYQMPAQQPSPSRISIRENEASAAAPAPAAKPRRKLRARKAAMTVTPKAIEQLHKLLSQPDPKLIRVGVKNRGCSGLAYHLEYVEKPGTFDEVVEQDGVKVLIDSKALFSIIGSEMDWHEDKLSQRFVFRNPNIKEQCGCGESFMV